jgi:hypothetical protein
MPGISMVPAEVTQRVFGSWHLFFAQGMRTQAMSVGAEKNCYLVPDTFLMVMAAVALESP